MTVILITSSSCGSQKEMVEQADQIPDDPYSLITEEDLEELEYYDGSELRFDDRVYHEDIKSVQLYPMGDPLGYPIITLDAGQPLELHFDDLGNDVEQYYYRIYHCNADWTKSDIIEMQYMDGFFSDILNNYDMSFNTLVPYVHYTATIPNQSMRLKISGNYLLVVTRDDDEEQPILSRRFMVVEPRVAIQATVKQSAQADIRPFAQLVDFELHHASFPINNPFRDIKTVVLQNYRWDRAITDLKPLFLKDRILEYRYDRGNVFMGGNEFRQFNISTTRYLTENIASIQRVGDRFKADLNVDYKRNLNGYLTYRDINGKYINRNVEGFNDVIESDYVDVRFQLDWPRALSNGSFYVFGGLSDWRASAEYRMAYNDSTHRYEATLPLEQGYYEYQYVFLKDMEDTYDETLVEGSFFETENDYTILVYYRDISNDYDQLIGSYTFTTRDRF
ncbi:MAG: DUF5103 domain-containing protein [Flavobacteriales bacterium]|nr:DUF5103 domain-containing protein [Flavobacteriales bacterium]